jgi:hypothetical protein
LVGVIDEGGEEKDGRGRYAEKNGFNDDDMDVDDN